MAIYTHNEVAGSPATYWGNIDATFVSATGASVVLNNTDGSQTQLSGTGITFTGSGSGITLTGGSITSMARTDATGTVVYEQVTGLGYAATAFQGHVSEANLNGVMQDVFSGNDTFNGFTGAETIKGFNGNDELIGKAGADALDGGAGSDTASYFNSPVPLTVDLGNPSNNTGDAVGDTYTSIENLRGSAFNDVLRGNGGLNVLEGGAGTDTLDGSGGFDYANYSHAATGLTADLLTPANNTGDALGDNYISNESLSGSGFADTLRGDTNSNVLEGGPGADNLDGRGGTDFASYFSALAAVTADLSTPSNNTGVAAGDTYTSIEGIIGSFFTDTLTGDSGNNFLRGEGGADILNGGTGSDWADYFDATTGVTVNLGTPANNTGEAAGDTFNSIENLRGGSFNDALVGDSNNNLFRGQEGNDVLNGGAGVDTADYTFATGGITATLSTTSSVTGDTSVGTDTLISIEGIRGSAFADTMTATPSFSGQNGTNVDFEGLAGNDTFVGNGTTRISYTQALAGVTIDLLAGNAHSTLGGDAANIGIDSFAGVIGPDGVNAVNVVRGSDFADTITAAGARGEFQFIGLKGNDTFTGSTEAINNFDINLARYDIVSNSAGTINDGVNVMLDASSTVTDITGGNAVGTDTLINVERVRGTNLHDTFIANAGFSGAYGTANRFEGMGGDDTITGNGHTYVQYSQALAAVTVNLQTGIAQSTAAGDAAGIGVDTITGGVNSATGSAFNDTLIGSNGAQAENLYGGAGNDVIDGGSGLLDRAAYQGDDAGVTVNLSTNSATDGFGGTDTLTNIEGVGGSEFNDLITGDGNVNRLQGQNGDDQLFGLGGDDLLVGDDGVDLYSGAFGTGGTLFDSGTDILDGGTGADQMWGGKGNDTYFVDNASDVVIENANEGTDTVNASTHYRLPANVENLVLDGSANLQGYGNALANTLTGNAGINLLSGGAGDDTYFVDNTSDAVLENVNEGTDTVHATDHFRLSANVENLVLDGSANLQGYGNALANTLTGNAGINLLSGGAGDDTYFVDNTSDAVLENANEGIDTVHATDHFRLSANVENLVLDGSANLQGYGNAGANTLTSNTGIDLLVGGAGDDTYVVNNAADYVLENANEGTDTVFASVHFGLLAAVENLTLTGSADLQGYGNGLVNTLTGNTGNNLLNGGGGADTMQGGLGNDTYFVDDALDVVVENAGEGTDAVFSTVSYALTANVETLVLQGSSDLSGIGNALSNALHGNAGSNTLDGGAGADMLVGNVGDDTFVFKSGQANGDTIFDFAGNGAAAGDALSFIGFGTAAQGATFTQIGATNQWQIHSGLDAHNEIITLSNGASVHPSDFLFG